MAAGMPVGTDLDEKGPTDAKRAVKRIRTEQCGTPVDSPKRDFRSKTTGELDNVRDRDRNSTDATLFNEPSSCARGHADADEPYRIDEPPKKSLKSHGPIVQRGPKILTATQVDEILEGKEFWSCAAADARSIYSARVDSIRMQFYWALEEPEKHYAKLNKQIRLAVAVICLGSIVVSLTVSVLETLPVLDDVPPLVWKVLEITTTLVFTVEYGLRLWVCDVFGNSAISWALHWTNICDLLSLLPTYFDLYGGSSAIASLRVLRVMRLFKLIRYSQGVNVMITALTNSLSALWILFFLIFVGVVIFASSIYFVEKMNCPIFGMDEPFGLDNFRSYNDFCYSLGHGGKYGSCCHYRCRGIPTDGAGPFSLCKYLFASAEEVDTVNADNWHVYAEHEASFKSIMHAMWWATVTMTTVGYGDIVPTFWLSKLIGILAMISGLLIIAMPFAIVGAKLGEAMNRYVNPDDIYDTGDKALKRSNCDTKEEQKKQQILELTETIRHNLEMKRQIIHLEELRDNIWTSIEHCLLSLSYEGALSTSATCEDKSPFTKRRRMRDTHSDVVLHEYNEGVCDESCGFFSKRFFLRRWAIRLSKSGVFDWLVVIAIVCNSVILMSQDYYPHREGETPWANWLQEKSDYIFVCFFAFECCVKVLANGFMMHHGAYMRDGWNWIDFAVVVAGLISLVLPEGDSLTVIRTFRVLRPLRTFSAMPGLRNLFNTILLSLPGLRDVVLLALFLMITFGLLGLHLFGPVMHRHCRLTPQPLHFTKNAKASECKGLCFDAEGSVDINSSLIYDLFCKTREQCDESYKTGSDYYLWPIDPDQGDRFCHEYQCQPAAAWFTWSSVSVLSPSEFATKLVDPLKLPSGGDGPDQVGLIPTTCGSELDDDWLYAPKVANPELAGINLNDHNLAINNGDFNWGYTTYDNLGWAVLVVFQSITLEGWTVIMYHVQDAFSNVLGFLYFVLLIIVGSFFLLNIVLAIVWDAFMDIKESEDTGQSGAWVHAQENLSRLSSFSLNRHIMENEIVWSAVSLLKLIGTNLFLKRNHADIELVLHETSDWRVVRWSRRVAAHPAFQASVIFIITLNVVVLGMDRHPQPVTPREIFLGLSTFCFVAFAIEFVILHVAVGPLTYWSDNMLAFDGVIVGISIVEIVNEKTSKGSGGGSAVTALRALRLLRIVKLAKNFKSMNILLKSGLATVLGMRDFVLLLFLIICIFALIGQSFFGGKYMFDKDDNVVDWSEMTYDQFVEKCPYDGNKPSCVPRAHFDTWMWSVTTIFQILSGENWNEVMYNGMRASGWTAFIFFWVVMLFGNFVILNLFLAYLMYNFDAQQTRIEKLFMLRADTRSRLISASASRTTLVSTEDAKVLSMAFSMKSDENSNNEEEKEEELTAAASQTLESIDMSPTMTQHEDSNGGLDIVPNMSQVTTVTGQKSTKILRFRESARQSNTPLRIAQWLSTFALPPTSPEERDMPIVEDFLPKKWTKNRVWKGMKKRTCLVCPEKFPLRTWCKRLTDGHRFEQLVIFLICLSSLLMMLQNPLNNPDGTPEFWLLVCNVLFTLIFAAEMLIKMIAFGIFCGSSNRPAYLQSSWNVLDSFIVIVSMYDVIISLMHEGSDPLSFMKAFRMARMMRPLRMISRNPNLKSVVNTIAASLPELRILLVFSLLFFLIFALLGVSMFKGSFHTCQELTKDGLEEFPFLWNISVIPICIKAAEPYGLRFVKPRTDTGCNNDEEEWERPTADTPICELHCDGEHSKNHPFCVNTVPWGYHVMRCTDCSKEFCSSVPVSDNCRNICQNENEWEIFCRDRNVGDRQVCIEHCEAECSCQDSCRGLVFDAANCVEQGGRWINRHQHFDTLEQGILSLFEICTTEGWVDLMLASVDSVGPYRRPERDRQELVGCLMFVAFIMLGSFFVLNLCVGVIVDKYGSMKDQKQSLMVTETQATWIAYQRALYLRKHFFPAQHLDQMTPTRAHLVRIVTTPAFERFVIICIVVNTICLGLVQYPSPGEAYDVVFDTLGTLFTAFYNVEAVLKLLAMGKNYFLEHWNVFDFTCVFISDAFLLLRAIVGHSMNSGLATVFSAIRIFRVARLFRLVRFLKGLNKLFFAFVLSIPKLFNVAGIMLLLIYLYAVLGMNLFALTTYGVNTTYNHNANFRTFPQAVSLLIRAMTGEGWNEFMHDLGKSKFEFQSYFDTPCEDDLDIAKIERFTNRSIVREDLYFATGPTWEPNACGSNWSIVYFTTYTILVTFVILNLFIAVIFEGFEESSKSHLADLLSHCVETWRRYDPNIKMEIPMDRAFDFIDECVEGLCQQYGKTTSPIFAMEPRWDPAYTGVNARSLLPLYSWRYVKITAITVTSDRKVRFIPAVRAVLRHMVCQGGLNNHATNRYGRMIKINEIEAMESLLEDETPTDLAIALLELRRMEEEQRQIPRTLMERTSNRVASIMHKVSRTLTHDAIVGAEINPEPRQPETELILDVAAAKLQLQYYMRKEARQVKEAFRQLHGLHNHRAKRKNSLPELPRRQK